MSTVIHSYVIYINYAISQSRVVVTWWRPSARWQPSMWSSQRGALVYNFATGVFLQGDQPIKKYVGVDWLRSTFRLSPLFWIKWLVLTVNKPSARVRGDHSDREVWVLSQHCGHLWLVEGKRKNKYISMSTLKCINKKIKERRGLTLCYLNLADSTCFVIVTFTLVDEEAKPSSFARSSAPKCWHRSVTLKMGSGPQVDLLRKIGIDYDNWGHHIRAAYH